MLFEPANSNASQSNSFFGLCINFLRISPFKLYLKTLYRHGIYNIAGLTLFFKESALPYGFIVMFLMGSHTHRDGREIL